MAQVHTTVSVLAFDNQEDFIEIFINKHVQTKMDSDIIDNQ